MTARMFLWLVAAILAGVVLAYVGFRGRRINRNPCCRQCGFDLTGVVPAGVTCPECGAGIKLAKYVRIGQRRRVYTLIVLGVPMTVLPLLPLALVLFTTMTRTDLGKYKPLPLLLWETQNLSEEDVRFAVKQILDRQTRGVLTEIEYGKVLEAMTAVHRDESKTWTAEWGDVVTRARLDGKLDKDALADFYAAAGVIDWSCRPTVRAGEKLPIVGTLKQTRLAPSMEVRSLQFLERITINGRFLRDFKAPKSDRAGGGFNIPYTTNSVQSIMLTGGGTNSWYGMEPQFARFTQTIPADLPPGEYTLGLDLAHAGHTFDRMQWQGPTNEEYRWARKSRTLSVRVVGPEEQVVRQISATDQQTASIASQISPTTQAWKYQQNQTTATVTFAMADCTAPLACRVYYKVGENRLEVGKLTTGVGSTGRFESSMRMSYTEGTNQILSFPIGKELLDKDGELVLVPDVALAERTPDLSEIYGGEIVIPGIRFSERDMYSATGTTSFTTPSSTQAEGEDGVESGDTKGTPKKKSLLELLFKKKHK